MLKKLIIGAVMAMLLYGLASAQVRRNPQINRRARPEVQEALTPQQEDAVIAYLRQFDMDRLDELIESKERRPQLYQRMIRRFYAEMVRLETIKKEDPDQYQRLVEERKMEVQSRKLARAIRESDDEAEKTKLRAELETLLDKAFDARQANRLREIEKLEERVTKLREDHAQRLKNKDEIVSKRLDQLLGTQSEMEW